MIEDREVVGVCSTYADLRAALKVRVSELRFTHLEIDEISGLQGGYTSKILCGTRHLGDTSLGPLLGALGLKIVFVRACGKHDDFSEEILSTQADCQKKLLSERARRGGLKKNRMMTNDERSEHCRRMAVKRWQKIRADKAERERKARRKAEAK